MLVDERLGEEGAAENLEMRAVDHREGGEAREALITNRDAAKSEGQLTVASDDDGSELLLDVLLPGVLMHDNVIPKQHEQLGSSCHRLLSELWWQSGCWVLSGGGAVRTNQT